MDGIRSSLGRQRVSFQSAWPTSFAPGEAPPRSLGTGWGGRRSGRRGPRSGRCSSAAGGSVSLGSRGLGGGRGRERRWEAPDPGAQALLRNFVVKSKGSEKKAPSPRAPSRPRPHAARRLCAQASLPSAAPPESGRRRAGREMPVAWGWG